MECNQITLKNSLLYRLYLLFNKNKIKSVRKSQEAVTKPHEYTISLKNHCKNEVILNIFKKLKPFEESVTALLHGSWADNTNNAFSDIDDFIIIDRSKINSKKHFYKLISLLNKIDMSYCRIDPLQHHGHWLVCKEELSRYDNSFMPLFIMESAKRILGQKEIFAHIDENKTNEGLKNNVINTCKNIEKLHKKYLENKINSYEMKGLVGSFVLMPSFLVQLQGLELNKPEAIKYSSKIYSREAQMCIIWATDCRNNWTIITSKKTFKMFKLATKFCTNPHIWRRFSKKYSPKISYEDKKSLSPTELRSKNVSSYIRETLKHLN
jgi:hypothetical protein